MHDIILWSICIYVLCIDVLDGGIFTETSRNKSTGGCSCRFLRESVDLLKKQWRLVGVIKWQKILVQVKSQCYSRQGIKH